MFKFRRILVALALNELDESVVRYAAMVATASGTERADFLHVLKDVDMPAGVRDAFPQVLESSVDAAEREMSDRIKLWFSAVGVETRVHIAEGAPLKPILESLRKYDTDLAIMGRSVHKQFLGTLSAKVARKAPCSVLIVPGKSPAQVRRILTPVDFSEQSGQALGVACEWARRSGGAPVEALHVYRVPIGFHRSGKTYEEFAELMRSHAAQEYPPFARRYAPEGVLPQPRFVLDEQTADAIGSAVKAQQADLLVLGARGRTNSAAALLGSVTEQCLAQVGIPLLAVKPKGDNMSLLDAILSL